MENDHRDSLPEFDVTYINQLFSSQKAAPKKESTPPTPKKPEPEPKPAVPEPKPAEPAPAAPTQRRSGNIFLLLTAAACLLLGFFLGRLSLPNTEPAPGTSIPLQTHIEIETIDPGFNSGIADDYASMSTQELVNIAVKISSLSHFGSPVASSPLTPDTYAALSRINPVLTELQQRPDAVKVLGSLATSGTEDYTFHAVNALITYYVNHCGFDLPGNMASGQVSQWIRYQDQYTVIYEYTKAPVITYTNSSGPCTVFDFGNAVYTLQGQNSWPSYIEGPNFWFCVELTQNQVDILEASPEPSLALDSSGEIWAYIQPCDIGWFVYGYTTDVSKISFSFSPKPGSSLMHHVELVAFPDYTDTVTGILAEDLYTHSDIVASLTMYNDRRDLPYYPAVAELLSRQGGISALLKYSMKLNRISDLLHLSTFQDRMTESEKAALQIMTEDKGYITATVLNHAAIQASGDGFQINGISGCYVNKIPSELQSIPLSQMNCWIYVPMTEGAVHLQQSSWKLEAKSGTVTLGAWNLYDIDTGKQIGWIVSGKMEEGQDIWLRLKQNATLLEKISVTPLLLDQTVEDS